MRRWSLLGAVVIATAMLTSCVAPVPTGPPKAVPPASTGIAPRGFTPGHLYVAQGTDIPSRVYRFPLNADGLPSTTPDGVLKLPYRYPGSIAIGPDGSLFVADSGTAYACKTERLCAVNVYAPLASGNAKPTRSLRVPQQPLWIAVDERGYLDVSILQGGGGVENVYAPSANGNDQPVNVINSDGANELGARRGILYVQSLRLGLGVEAIGETNGKQPVYYTYGYNYSADGVATDDHTLYAQFFQPRSGGYFLATAEWRIGVPGPPFRTVIGRGCKQSRSGGALGYGLAVYKKYLYEGCIALLGASGGVLVYDLTKGGKQKPIEQLVGGNVGVAIGP